MQIRLPVLGTRKVIVVEVEETDTIGVVKQKILEQEGVALEHQTIRYGGYEVFSDDTIMSSIGPEKLGHLMFMYKLPGVVSSAQRLAAPTAQSSQKLLVLDVEGTIISGYDYSRELPGGRFPAIIDSNIAIQLQKFKDAGGFKIVLATGTDDDNLKYYREQFKVAGIAIDVDSPITHDRNDSKTDKLRKYSEQFSVAPNDIYFFDDADKI